MSGDGKVWLGQTLRMSKIGLAASIHDLAAAHLRNPSQDARTESDMREIAKLATELIKELEHG